MAFYALGDLHLSHAVDKPMDVFGSGWDITQKKLQNTGTRWFPTMTSY